MSEYAWQPSRLSMSALAPRTCLYLPVFGLRSVAKSSGENEGICGNSFLGPENNVSPIAKIPGLFNPMISPAYPTSRTCRSCPNIF